MIKKNATVIDLLGAMSDHLTPVSSSEPLNNECTVGFACSFAMGIPAKSPNLGITAETEVLTPFVAQWSCLKQRQMTSEHEARFCC